MTSSGVAIRHGPLMAHGIHAQAALPSKLPGAPSVRAQQLCDARAMSVRYSSCAPQRLLLAWLLVRTIRALRNACSCTIPPFHRIPHPSEHDAIPTGPPAHMPSSPAPSFLVVWGKPPILHMMGSGMASILGGGFGPHGAIAATWASWARALRRWEQTQGTRRRERAEAGALRRSRGGRRARRVARNRRELGGSWAGEARGSRRVEPVLDALDEFVRLDPDKLQVKD